MTQKVRNNPPSLREQIEIAVANDWRLERICVEYRCTPDVVQTVWRAMQAAAREMVA